MATLSSYYGGQTPETPSVANYAANYYGVPVQNQPPQQPSGLNQPLYDAASYYGASSYGNLPPHLGGPAIDRSQFFSQLNDRHTMRAFAGRMATEVGSQGRVAQIAWAETTFNRAAARNLTLLEAVTGNYFPTYHPGSSNNKVFHAIIRMVAEEGINITNGSTGNASGTVMFAGGPQMFKANGERFGVEGPDRGWWRRSGRSVVHGVGDALAAFGRFITGAPRRDETPSYYGAMDPLAAYYGATTSPTQTASTTAPSYQNYYGVQQPPQTTYQLIERYGAQPTPQSGSVANDPAATTAAPAGAAPPRSIADYYAQT